MVTVNDALNYLGIDYADDLVIDNVTRCINTSQKLIEGAIGDDVENVLKNDARIDELTLIYVEDLYNNRGTNLKTSSAKRNIVQSMELQLKMDYRAAKERDSP
ncbi:MAG: head-tail connector protein [Acutalibacteraceae bacterium]